jgi:hypothetical protein
MDIGSGATILVNVELEGIEQGRAALNAFGTVGEASARRVQDAYKQVAASAMDFARAGANANQIAQLTGSSMAAAREATQLYAKTLATTGEEVHGLKLANQELAEAGFLRVANATKTATQAVAAATPNLNAIRGAMLGSFALGAGPMIAILGGIAAVGYAWKSVSEESHKAAEEQKKLTDALKDWYETEKLGVGGERVKQLEAQQKAVKSLADEYARLRGLVEDASKAEQKAGATGTNATFGQYAGGIGSSASFFQGMAGGIGSSDATFSGIANGASKAAVAIELKKQREIEDAAALDLLVQRTKAFTDAQDVELRLLTALAAGIPSVETLTVKYGAWTAQLIAGTKAANATKDIWQQMRATINAAVIPETPVDWQAVFALPSNADAQKYTDDLERIFQDGFARIASDGTKSFHDFFEDVFSMFSQLMRRMEQENKNSGFGYGALKYGTAALAGGLAGYQVGQQIGSPGLGALGGAAAGALAGSAAGPWGAAIGGLVGAAGGLLGAANAQKQAAAALHAVSESAQSRENAFVQGGQGPVGSQLAGLDSAYYAISQELKQLAAKGVDVGGRQDTLGKAYSDQRLKIYSDAIGDLGAQLNAVNGAAGAYANALNDIEYKYRANMETAKALGLQEQLTGQVEEIRRKSIEALAEAQQQQIRQTNLSLDARQAAARGDDDAAEAIRRRAQEEAELFEAQKAGWTDEQIARLQYIQGLEDVADAQRKAAESAKKNADAQASYTERYLRATGQDDALFDFQQAREWAQIVNDFTKGLIDDVTMAAGRQALDAEKAAREYDRAAAAAEKARDIQRQAIQEQIRGAQEILNATRQAIDGARRYLDSSKLGGLSPLGPEARYAEARRQYLALGSAADAGDVKAFAQLPDAIEAFRKESQNMFASSGRYREDFNSSQIFLESLTGKFGVQATIQEQMLAVLTQQLARLQPSALPVEIAKAIPPIVLPPSLDAGIDPVRRPVVPENPGIYPPGRGRGLRFTIDDLVNRLDVMNDRMYNQNAKADSINEVLAHTHNIISLQLPEQTGLQRATANNTAATTTAVGRLRQIGDGNGAI